MRTAFIPSEAAAKASFPKGSRPGTMKSASSAIRPRTVFRSPAWLADIQVATSSRIARSSSLMRSSLALHRIPHVSDVRGMRGAHDLDGEAAPVDAVEKAHAAAQEDGRI